LEIRIPSRFFYRPKNLRGILTGTAYHHLNAMKNEPKDQIDFRAWRDIEPPGDFTQNVMRRIRTQPAREPRWHELLAAFFSSRLAFSASLATSLIIAVIAVRSGPVVHDQLSLQPNSLIVAYEKMAGGK
jgi:hypothetical protein